MASDKRVIKAFAAESHDNEVVVLREGAKLAMKIADERQAEIDRLKDEVQQHAAARIALFKANGEFLEDARKAGAEIDRLRTLNAKLVESLKDLVEECREHDNEYQHVTRPPRLAKALGILAEMKEMTDG